MGELVRTYYETGELKEEYFIFNDKKEGEYKSYHSNGWELSKDNSKLGNLSSTNFHGQLHVVCNYINDKKEGEYKSYHSNGFLKEVCNYINDKKDG